jgi:DNA helicase-2/ATP-dependent DNA helicase PcrA
MPIDLQAELNEKQYLAASAIEGPVLIIAGAGSGKTRMITFRIAHMLDLGIPQSSILALTFTNKAAKEMAERVKRLTGKRLTQLHVSTFHAFGVQVLKKEIHRLGFREHFSIYDSVDKNSLLKECARELGLSPESLDLWEISNLFSGIRTERISWDRGNLPYKKLYDEYRDHLRVFNAVDFDDLIMTPMEIFKKFPSVLHSYRERYRFIMVDEFQDTSLAQYRLVKMLAEKHRNLCVVGDDDQSIYSWRGANFENILNFEKDFEELQEIKLEQNYRSTANILEAANSVIAHNQNRKDKELWTGTGTGKAIEIYYPHDENEEGRFIADMIKNFAMREGVKYHDIGILVRTNNLTATLEESLLSENIPYKISGGSSFFERKEIRDVISYMRVLSNPEDDLNFLRIINTPRRGLGKTSIEHIRNVADKNELSLHAAAVAMVDAPDNPLPKRSTVSLQEFLSLLDTYRERVLNPRQMVAAVRELVDDIGYWGFLVQENINNEKAARWKWGNIAKFIEMFERWAKDPDTEDPNIFSYLNRISLVGREDEDAEQGKVNLMTIHASKGLEFDLVFLAGVEEGLIPHDRSIEEDPDNVEEERRLFYVAITRARLKLYMTSCQQRKKMRETVICSPSPFLDEIPEKLIEYHKGEEALDVEDALKAFEAMKEKFSN